MDSPINKGARRVFNPFEHNNQGETEKGVSCPLDPLIINWLGKVYYMPIDQLLMESKGQYSDLRRSAQRELLEMEFVSPTLTQGKKIELGLNVFFYMK